MKYSDFLEKWRFFTKGNETPELIHIWAGISTLAGACEKRLWLDRGFFKLYLNQYILIIAPPGVCGKSVTMDVGANLLEEAGYTILESAVTKEKVVEEMLDAKRTFITPQKEEFSYSAITINADELSVLLSTGTEMVKFLVEIWGKDKHYSYRTKNAGVYNVSFPYLNLMTNAVPQWFGETIASDMASTGFLARCIIIYEDQKRGKYPETFFSDEQKRTRKRLLEMLLSIGELYGEVKLNENARQLYNQWYMDQDIDTTEDYRIIGYLERRTKVHVLKIAALMAIGDMRLEIDTVDIERSINLFQRTEAKMKFAFTLTGANKLAPHISRITAMLDKNIEIPIRDIVRTLWSELNHEDIKGLVSIIQSMEIAEKVKINGIPHLRKIDKWKEP